MTEQIHEDEAYQMYLDAMAELTPEERVDFRTWCRDNQIEPV